jgi:hypothetical protein
MTEWPTVDEVIAQWSEGVGCVAEPSPTLHPSMLPAVLPGGAPGRSTEVEQSPHEAAAPSVDPRLWRGVAFAIVPSAVLWAGIVWVAWRVAS